MADDDFNSVLQQGGVFDAKVLSWYLLDWDLIEQLCAIDCTRCEKELKVGDFAYVFAEPFGTHAAMVVHCSEACANESVHEWWERERNPDDESHLYISYYAMNWQEVEGPDESMGDSNT